MRVPPIILPTEARSNPGLVGPVAVRLVGWGTQPCRMALLDCWSGAGWSVGSVACWVMAMALGWPRVMSLCARRGLGKVWW